MVSDLQIIINIIAIALCCHQQNKQLFLIANFVITEVYTLTDDKDIK